MSKHQKRHQKQKTQTQAINDLQNKLDAAIAENQQTKEILRPESLQKVIAQAVNSSCTKGTSSAFGKPFLGTSRPPQLMPGFDGSLEGLKTLVLLLAQIDQQVCHVLSAVILFS